MASEIYKLRQFIIKKFLKQGKTINWPAEMKITHKLLEFNSDPKFWVFLDLGFSLNSLAFLLSERGREILNKAILLFSYVPPEEQQKYEISDEKFGENKVIEKKKKTIMDVLS